VLRPSVASYARLKRRSSAIQAPLNGTGATSPPSSEARKGGSVRATKRLLATVAALVALGSPAVARADVVTDWNAIASNSIIAVAGQVPHQATPSFAMVQGAVYDAINAIDRGYQPYLVTPAANPWDSKEAAGATAAYKVLVGLFPGQVATLQPVYDSYIGALPDEPAGSKAAGIAIGEAAAAAMLAARADDDRNPPDPFPFVFGTEPGQWRLAPPQGATGIVSVDPAPWLGSVRPFLFPDVEMLRTEPPNPLTSAEYADEYNEVKELGSLTSSRRTADQTQAAIFWQDHGSGIWNRVLRSLDTRPEMDVVKNARLFGMADLAAADAAIACWDNKYYWNFWRPITAIREGDNDGNPATQGDPSWTPLFDPTVPVSGPKLVTPGFPDHPAGHGCVTGTYVHVLQDFFGTDKVTFTVTSNKCLPAPCRARTFDRFSDALKEVIGARVWGGIHFRSAVVQGGVIGNKVAHYMAKHYFQPTG
jgi:hypothetical protein